MLETIPRLNEALSGRYEIERDLGEGGMATVYLADDRRHERKVAIKVLKPELAAVIGADRFLTEIKTTANLQHPHILPLFDSGEADGFLYYVMPYVEGESLRERLDREKQVPVDDAVAITRAVASALDYAHRQNVIHRDIKPANILIHAGEPLVADFGIALAVSVAGGNRLTETGLSLGTPHYMSPEQATAERELDGRSDLYSLACVTYEMLAGEPPFTGPTSQAVVARILTDEPTDLTTRRRAVSPARAAAVHRALEKLPADRFATAADFGDALARPVESIAASPGRPTGERAAPPGWLVPTLATALIAALGLTVWAWFGRGPSVAPGPVWRSSVALTGDHRLAIAEYESLPLAISPDGETIAYVGESPSGRRLYVRPAGSFESTPLPGTDEARQPFFSPHSEQVAYFARDGLYQVRRSGSPPVRIASVPLRTRGGAWGPDDTIVFAAGGDLWRVPVAGGGGEPERIPVGIAGSPEGAASNEARNISRAGVPTFLPGGRHVLAPWDDELIVISLADGTARSLNVRLSGHAFYVRSGHLVYTETSGEALAVRFDAETLAITGSPVSFLENVFRPNMTPATLLAVSANGTLAYASGGGSRNVVLVDRQGRPAELPLPSAPYRFPRFSPDGRYLAVSAFRGPTSILELDTERNWMPGGGGYVWSPDGRELLGSAGRVGIAPGSTPEHVQLLEGFAPLDWGADGVLLLAKIYGEDEQRGGIYTASIDGDVPPEVWLDSEHDERGAARSPDGRLVAYVSDASGRQEVYARPFAGGEARLVSLNGGYSPVFSRSSDEIYYWHGEQAYVVRIESLEELEFSAPEPLFSGRYFFSGPAWDISPSGEFALITAGPNWLREIRVVQNWFDELEGLFQEGPP